MTKINILCIGKLKESYLREAVQEYTKRLSAFCKLNIIELDEYKILDKNPVKAQIDKCIEEEGKSILSKIPKNSYVVALCIEGKRFSSKELSSYISELQTNKTSSICIIIGGSWGLSKEVKGFADLKLSLSDMTFTHQLTRVMVCEQIYRAFQIMNSGKYHK